MHKMAYECSHILRPRVEGLACRTNFCGSTFSCYHSLTPLSASSGIRVRAYDTFFTASGVCTGAARHSHTATIDLPISVRAPETAKTLLITVWGTAFGVTGCHSFVSSNFRQLFKYFLIMGATMQLAKSLFVSALFY